MNKILNSVETAKDFVLQEVIDDLVNNRETLVTPLLKLAHFGRLTKNKELIDYTNNELHGYPKKGKTPEYRRQMGTIKVTIEGYSEHYVREIPATMFDALVGPQLKYISINESIEIVETWAKQAKERNEGEKFGYSLPMEILPKIAPMVNRLYPPSRRLAITKAFVETHPTLAIKIVNFVRLKMLDMAYKLAEEFGNTITINSSKPNTQLTHTITNIMNQITNTGDGNITSTGDNSPITATIKIQKGDSKALREELKSHGLEDVDIDELTEILKPFKKDATLTELPVPVNDWLGKIYGKALSSGGKIAIGAVGGVVSAAIRHYLHLP